MKWILHILRVFSPLSFYFLFLLIQSTHHFHEKKFQISLRKIASFSVNNMKLFSIPKKCENNLLVFTFSFCPSSSKIRYWHRWWQCWLSVAFFTEAATGHHQSVASINGTTISCIKVVSFCILHSNMALEIKLVLL